MRIRSLLVLMAIAILLPVVLAAGIALDQIREGERAAALKALRETARATSLIVDREVQGSLSALKALSHSRSLQQGDLEAFYAEAGAINQLPDVWTLLVDQNGQQVLNTIAPFGGKPPPAPSAEAASRLAQLLASDKPEVSELLVGPVTGKLLTAVAVPAPVGPKRYLLVQAFAVDHWRRTLLQQKLPPDWIVAVIDRNGRFIARSHKTDEFLGNQARPELVAAAAKSRDGLIRHATLEGIESYDAFEHSSLTGWTIAVAAPVQSIEAPSRHALQVAMLGLALAVAAALLAAGVFGQLLIKAIERAGRAAIALGEGRRPEVERSPIAEVGQLHQSLADAGTLLDAERRSRLAAEAERERLLRNETAAREAAQAQNDAKDQFLAMLGHELRNPLAAISGAVTLLERGAADPARAAHYLEIVRRQNLHLVHIVDDLLDVSRLMAGKIMLEKTPLNMADSVTHCVESLRASEKGLGHRIVARVEPVWVDGDPVRIEQVLNNLITNALKFSPPGGRIGVELQREDGRAVVTVRDEGAGIAADLLERVFEPFVQGPPPSNRAQSGLGIGLALVRQLVGLHGGQVEAASAGPGQGSTFRFWLPAIESPAQASESTAAGERTARRIVYVEDNADARMTMAELLRVFGYEVFEVGEGKLAHAAVLEHQPDVVVMDIGLPDVDGYQVARRLRKDAGTRHVPLIALTGYGQLRDKEQAAVAGFDAHLTKPVAPDDLIAAIEAAVADAAQAQDRPAS
jgi:signal transduction histidine kinase/ActR/RegA family two-component response regulator